MDKFMVLFFYMGKYSCEASSFFCYTEESNVPLEEPWR